jgi:DNA-binding NarL/FixJ family response regulator
MTKVRAVLLVEDHPSLQRGIGDLLVWHFGSGTQVHITGTIVTTEVLVSAHKDYLDLILMDTSLGNGVFTFDLTERIRKFHGYRGQMIATSIDEGNHPIMIKRGCSDAWLKHEIRERLRKHFPVSQETT